MQQVLHMQRVNTILRVVLDELVGDEQGLVGIRRSQAVERETTGKTSNGTEQRLESLRQMVRNEVLVDLHHGNDRLLRVGQLSLNTDTKKLLVMNPAVGYEPMSKRQDREWRGLTQRPVDSATSGGRLYRHQP